MLRSLSCAFLLGSVVQVSAQVGPGTIWRYEMSELPDTDPSWERIGDGYALLLDGAKLAINDNSNADRIAFQTLVGEIEAGQELHVRASLQVLSNLMGQAATLEIARPGLEIILRCFPQQLVLGERDADGGFRWLGQVAVDLSTMRQIELVKLASGGVGIEDVSLALDGVEVLRVTPHGLGTLGVGRVLFGSLSLPDMGASIWDWLEIELHDVVPQVPTAMQSFGALKSRFGG